MLQLKDISFSYPDSNHDVLHKINLEVNLGETIAILGPSGVGKTTLFHLIAGILPVQSGTITLNGSNQVRGEISYMLQKDMLYDHYTVEKNIMLPRIIQGESAHEAKKHANHLLEMFGLEKWANFYPHALSGGMRQRVAFMRTAAFGRKWLLLDEAFSALDAITRRSLHQWFLETSKKLDWSSLMITHDVDEALILADRIYVLKGQPGEIVYTLKSKIAKTHVKEIIFDPDFLENKRILLNQLD